MRPVRGVRRVPSIPCVPLELVGGVVITGPGRVFLCFDTRSENEITDKLAYAELDAEQVIELMKSLYIAGMESITWGSAFPGDTKHPA